MQHLAFDSIAGLFVYAIVLDINGRRGSILLADSMNAGRIAIGGNVFFENLGTERTVAEGIIENCFRSAE